MRVPRLCIRTLMIAVVVAALVLGACLAYRSVTRPPADVLDFVRTHPDQPKPEMVATGISPALLCLLFVVPAGAMTMVFIVWRRHYGR